MYIRTYVNTYSVVCSKSIKIGSDVIYMCTGSYLQGTEVVNKEGGFNYYYTTTEISILLLSVQAQLNYPDLLLGVCNKVRLRLCT